MDYLGNVDDYKMYLDMQHSEAFQSLKNFYSKKTMMDVLGVARQENPHSSFLRWMMNPKEDHGFGDFAFRKFCETICFAYKKYAHDYLVEDENIRKGSFIKTKGESGKDLFTDTQIELIRSRFLFFSSTQTPKNNEDKEKIIKALMTGDFEIDDYSIGREIRTEEKKEKEKADGRRADIWINCKLNFAGEKEPVSFVFLIENKVTSKENNNQTHSYITDILKRLSKDHDLETINYFIPVYLHVATNEEMKVEVDDKHRSNDFPCFSRLFLVINYQYLLDGMIMPSYIASSDNRTKDRLSDYISCLGQSIYEQEEEGSGRNCVMAVSSEEKKLALQLWNDHKEVLRDIGINLGSSDHFVLRNDNKQFYYSILSAIRSDLSYEEDGMLIEAINNAFSKTYTYKIKTKDGIIIELGSHHKPGYNVSAMAYVILKQYLLLNPKKKKIEDIKEMLCGKIKNNWLCGIFVTNDECDELYKSWKGVHDKKSNGECVCDKYANEKLALIQSDCVLDDGAYNRFSRKYNGNVELEKIVREKSCPIHSDIQDGQLRKYYYGKLESKFDGINVNLDGIYLSERCKIGKGCHCIYDFLHNFFVKDLFERGLFGDEELKTIKRIGCNTIFPHLPCSGGGDYVYVGRWWFSSDIEKMKDILKDEGGWIDIEDYISVGINAPSKSMQFTKAELWP